MGRIIFILSVVFSITAQAQVRQAERYEIVQRYSDEDFTIIPLEEDGLALFRKKSKFNERNRIWELILLDTAVTPRKTMELEVDNLGELMGYEHSNGFVHFLFIKNEIKGDLEIISVNLSTYEQDRVKIVTELKINLTHFNKCGDNFIFGGEVELEPAVFIYIPSTKNFKIIPGFFKKRTELIDVRLNNNHTFNTVLISRENIDNSKIIFRTFDSFGKQLVEDVVSVQKHSLQTGMSTNLKRDDLMILGTWGKAGENRSAGFYGVPINPFSDQEIKFTFLGQLQHYLDHIKPKRAERIREKTKRALEEGTYPDYSNYIIPHRIIEHEKGFILLAETYIPLKDNSTATYNPHPYPYYNNPYGYRYGPYYPGSGIYNMNDSRYYGDNITHEQEIKTIQSQVILFTPDGEVISDYSIDLEDIKMPSLNQITDFYLDKDDLYFLYKKESDLIVKKISLRDESVTESTHKVKMKSPMDIIRSESQDGRIRHWHGKNFYMYGYQTVKFEDGRAKEIFYINRVVID